MYHGLTEKALDILDRRHASRRITHGAQIQRRFTRAQHKLANAIDKLRVLAPSSLNPIIPRLRSNRDRSLFHTLVVSQHLVEGILVESVIVAEVGIAAR
jgi:hypothetical protein